MVSVYVTGRPWLCWRFPLYMYMYIHVYMYIAIVYICTLYSRPHVYRSVLAVQTSGNQNMDGYMYFQSLYINAIHFMLASSVYFEGIHTKKKITKHIHVHLCLYAAYNYFVYSSSTYRSYMHAHVLYTLYIYTRSYM